ncbi:MAG TPA: FHA domain-containing protein [Gaiellaceae bacterium]|nr:FHA domain-containing protein [Gaiellaceae bacterium]
MVTAAGTSTAEPGETITVGRGSAATVRVDDPLVSREHLKISPAEGGWLVEDVGSSNGTFVDGQRLESFRVEAPTVVRLGDAEAGPEVELVPVAVAEPEPAPRPVVQPTMAPTGGMRPGELTVVHELHPGAVTIGRSPSCDIVLDDPLVSRHHAELRELTDGRRQLVDLGSYNGTFVNGRRVNEAVLDPLDLVGIGGSEFRLAGETLQEIKQKPELGLVAVGITVTTKAKAVLADDVGFALEEGSLLAVVGPSGAGKSTLLGALTGLRPAPRGSVYFGGRDLYTDYDELRQRIGFVPQDDVVHPELTVEQSLNYAAELRFAPDVTADERHQRVEDVLGELGLAERRHLPVAKLSGGQRKRVSVAIELLTKPSLLFLDEPTSGLDPGLERSLMELLRTLADGGRTVVVVTHSTESLNLCDRVLFLAPGGRTAYYGPPQLALAYFGLESYQEVFRALSDDTPEEVKARFLGSEPAQRYLTGPLEGYEAGVRPEADVEPLRHQKWIRQYWMLTRRYARVLAGDRANVVALLGAAPLLGLLQLWRMPTDQFKVLPAGQFRLVPQASLVLLVLAIGMTMMGFTASLREVVKELPVFKRERAVGLSTSAYVLSKMTILGLIIAYEAVVYMTISTANQGGPKSAVLIGWPLGELILAAIGVGIAAVAIGLLVSSLVNSVAAAIAVLPVLLIVQLLIMQGGVLDNKNKPVLYQLSFVSSAGWGFADMASTVKLNDQQAVWNVAKQVSTVNTQDPQALVQVLSHPSRGNPRWNHQKGAWLRAFVALLVLTAAALGIAIVALRRFDPV